MSGTESEGRHALIVATATYSDPKLAQLRAPAADAERLASVLRDPEKGDFDVDVLVNEGQATLTRAIARFFRDRRPDDLLLLHFSCHGIKDDRGELFLAASDTELDLLSATGVSAAWLNDQISRTRSRRTVVLLDCCFSGSFPFGLRARGSSVDAPEQFQGRGRALITASSSMEYAYEGDELRGEGQPSVFTEAVVEGLETGRADLDGDQLVSIDDLYNYVYDCVKQRTPSQTPNKKSELEGPLYLARSSYRPPVEPARLDPELLARTEDRYAGIRHGAVQELTALLASSDPAVALAAREALERVVNDDSRQVSESAQAALRTAGETVTARDETPAAPVGAEPEIAPAEPERVETAPAVATAPGRRLRLGNRARTGVALGAAVIVALVIAVVVFGGGGGGSASGAKLTPEILRGIPAGVRSGHCSDSAKPCCDVDRSDPWIKKEYPDAGVLEMADCSNSPFGNYLVFARFKTHAQAETWAGNAGSGSPCRAAITERMGQLHSAALTRYCEDVVHGPTDQQGIYMWWVDRGSTVLGWYQQSTHDHEEAVSEWELMVNSQPPPA